MRCRLWKSKSLKLAWTTRLRFEVDRSTYHFTIRPIDLITTRFDRSTYHHTIRPASNFMLLFYPKYIWPIFKIRVKNKNRVTSLSLFGPKTRILRGFSSINLLVLVVNKKRNDLNCRKSLYHFGNVSNVEVMTSQTWNN